MDEIAIIGIGCLFPDAENTEQYWRNLIDMKDCTTSLSKQELGVDPAHYYHPVKGTPDKMSYCKNGHIREFEFDPSRYRIPTKELNSLGTLFKWTIYAADQALEDSGYKVLNNAEINRKYGLIAGNIGMPTHETKKEFSGFYSKILEPYIQELIGDKRFKFDTYWDTANLSEYNVQTGSYNAVIAAQALGLSGPCHTIDAACSSALYAIRTACYHLNNREIDMMLAGAVCHADHVYLNCGFNVLQALPDKGESIPLDLDSDGMKTGEGAGFLVLKRYCDAVRDNDKIYGIIESFGFSNDAGKKHILVPDHEGQLLALERAYIHISNEVDYIECHATGTPVGDQVELDSIEKYFSQNGQIPLIGANKGNIGHMMTASGMASVIKVLLGMKYGTIPGTIKITKLVDTKLKKLTIDHVVRANRSWPNNQRPKRAGINAFGFGGVNGHMVLREHTNQPQPALFSKNENKTMPMAIVGMGIEIASTLDIDDFNTTIREGRQLFRALPRTRWAGIEQRSDVLEAFGMNEAPLGGYIEKYEFDCKRFKLPPNTIGIHLLSHMMLMKIATKAYYNAGYKIDGIKRNIAVIVAGDVDYICHRYQARNEIVWQIRESLQRCAIELSDKQVEKLETIVKDSLFPEPNPERVTGGIGNIVASRISAVLQLNGPAFVLSSNENSVAKAIELAEFMLSQNEVEAVIVGSCSFGGGLENILWHSKRSHINRGKRTLGYDVECDGWVPGEGGGVIVLKREQDAKRDKNRIFSTIRSLCIVNRNESSGIGFEPSADGVYEACIGALKKAALKPADIGYIEVHSSGIQSEDKAEIEGLCRAYAYSEEDNACVIGSIKSNYGHLLAASGMASIIKTALCLYYKYLPGTPQWGQPKYSELFDHSRLRIKHDSQNWTTSSKTGYHFTAVNSLGIDRSYAHIIMQEPDSEDQRDIQDIMIKKGMHDNAFITTVYLGREKIIPEIILTENNRNLFKSRPSQGTSTDIETACVVRKSESNIVDLAKERETDSKRHETYEPSYYRTIHNQQMDKLYYNQYLRNAETQLQYLRIEQQFYRRATTILDQKSYFHSLYDIESDDSVPYYESGDWIQEEKQINDYAYRTIECSSQVLAKKMNKLVFNEEQLIEMTDGLVANVLGPDYSATDQYPIRTRMPSPPYMFVSRITKLTAQKDVIGPCTIEWEYDIPQKAWYVYNGVVPNFVSFESSHAMIVAFTYIGCDQLFKGRLRYRVIDSKTTIYSALPKVGETLKGRLDITSFDKIGKNFLITYEFNCYVNNDRVFKLVANSGFFLLKDMQKSKALNTKKYFLNTKQSNTQFKPPLVCDKASFSDDDINVMQNGNLQRCFGDGYGVTKKPVLCATDAKMIDRIIEIDSKGGAWGLGIALGEKDINPNHWAFKAHFKNDPVMPGTLLVEGCEQLVKFYIYYIGLHSQTNLQQTTLINHQYSATFRGEVKREKEKLRYRLTCKKIDANYQTDGQTLTSITIIFISEFIYKGKVIGICDNLGVRYVDKKLII